MVSINLNRRGRSQTGAKNVAHMGNHHHVLDSLRPNDHILGVTGYHHEPSHRKIIPDPGGIAHRLLRRKHPPNRPRLRPHHRPSHEESVKQPTSYNRIASIASTVGKKVSVDTIIDYVSYLKESWLILPFENIVAKLTERESNRKYYFIDNGILDLFLVDPVTSLLENQVAIRLRQLYGERVYYYNKNVEVDFVVYDEGIAIQVSYSMADSETERREVDALLKFSKVFPVNKLLIITKDEEREIKVGDRTIQVLPVWKWLLGI